MVYERICVDYRRFSRVYQRILVSTIDGFHNSISGFVSTISGSRISMTIYISTTDSYPIPTLKPLATIRTHHYQMSISGFLSTIGGSHNSMSEFVSTIGGFRIPMTIYNIFYVLIYNFYAHTSRYYTQPSLSRVYQRFCVDYRRFPISMTISMTALLIFLQFIR